MTSEVHLVPIEEIGMNKCRTYIALAVLSIGKATAAGAPANAATAPVKPSSTTAARSHVNMPRVCGHRTQVHNHSTYVLTYSFIKSFTAPDGFSYDRYAVTETPYGGGSFDLGDYDFPYC
jgi:hypothetical protein